MDNENRISLKIPEADIVAITNAIKVLQDKLMPHMVILTTEERGSLTKMGDKNTTFVNKCTEFMQQNPSLMPQYVNLEEMKIDLDAVGTLYSFYIPISQLVSAIDDSMMLSGSEAYIAALAFYHNVKGAARANVPGAKNIIDELKKQFTKKSKKKDDNSETKNES